MTNMTAGVSIRLKPDTRADLLQLAQEDKRKLAEYLRLVLEKHVEEQYEQLPSPV